MQFRSMADLKDLYFKSIGLKLNFSIRVPQCHVYFINSRMMGQGNHLGTVGIKVSPGDFIFGAFRVHLGPDWIR